MTARTEALGKHSSLTSRLVGVDLWGTGGHQATISALDAQLRGSSRQRCVKRQVENVLSYIRRQQRDRVQPELGAICYQADRQAADQEEAAFCAKYGGQYLTAVACLRPDLGVA